MLSFNNINLEKIVTIITSPKIILSFFFIVLLIFSFFYYPKYKSSQNLNVSDLPLQLVTDLKKEYYFTTQDFELWRDERLFDKAVIQVPGYWQRLDSDNDIVAFGAGIQRFLSVQSTNELDAIDMKLSEYTKRKQEIRKEEVLINDIPYTRYVIGNSCTGTVCSAELTEWVIEMEDNFIFMLTFADGDEDEIAKVVSTVR